MSNQDNLIKTPAGWLLIGTAALSLTFVWWLGAEKELDQVRRFAIEYERLMVRNRHTEAKHLFDKITAGDGPLDPIWVGLLETQLSGYHKLEAYVRIMAGDPEREATYQEIADLIAMAPESFQLEVKPLYLSDLASVPGVSPELLKKHNLHP